jgi:hypothetical protein
MDKFERCVDISKWNTSKIWLEILQTHTYAHTHTHILKWSSLKYSLIVEGKKTTKEQRSQADTTLIKFIKLNVISVNVMVQIKIDCWENILRISDNKYIIQISTWTKPSWRIFYEIVSLWYSKVPRSGLVSWLMAEYLSHKSEALSSTPSTVKAKKMCQGNKNQVQTKEWLHTEGDNETWQLNAVCTWWHPLAIKDIIGTIGKT